MDARRVASSLRAIDVRPSKGRGQNFLTSQAVVDRIAALTGAGRNDTIVEIGPGLGALTGALTELAGQVTAIEIDERLAEHLMSADPPGNLSVVTGDALTLPEETFVPESGEYVVAANLPYSVGAAIVRRFLELAQPPRRMVVMLQREVAERMAAKPGDLSLLGVAVQLYAHPTLAFHVPPSAFKPRPKVESTVLVLEPHAHPLLEEAERAAFFEVLHAGFHQKRKQLANTLSSGLDLPKAATIVWLEENGIDPTRRAESLSVEEWLTLVRSRPGHG
ncbi:MAG: ribosomal RNA small subunit methyltransferase A [Thermomicrobiales bacterium]|nr:ribosomal RNA small subunit methyltransferase A [Thermomicrobiales bacterium]